MGEIIKNREAILGFKKAIIFTKSRTEQEVLVTLVIPKGNKVHMGSPNASHKDDKKCRSSSALVVSIESLDGKRKFTKAHSRRHLRGHPNPSKRPMYQVGRLVKCDKFGTEPRACSGGIHFFLREDQATSYRWN